MLKIRLFLQKARRTLAQCLSWGFFLPTISVNFWVPMFVTLAIVLPTIVTHFPSVPASLTLPWVPEWVYRLLYIPWLPLILAGGFLMGYLQPPLSGIWLQIFSKFIMLIRPWILLPGFILFLASLIQLMLARRRKGKWPVTGGFYSVVRHPQYLGIMIWTLGHLLYALPLHLRAADLLAWVTLVFLYLHLAESEERNLQREFGEDYSAYKRRVPFILPFTSPDLKILPTERRKRIKILLIVYALIIVYGLFFTWGYK